MKKISCWIEAMRLRTLPVSVAGVLTAIGFNILDGTFQPAPAAICLLYALLCQIASNFANEYFDFKAGRDKAGREGPRRGVTEGDITPKAMLTAIVSTVAVACAAGLSLIYWGGWWLIAAGILVALGLFAYSAGPKPLSTIGLGELAVLIFFGIVPVNLTYYIQAHDFTWEVMAASLTIGLMGANVLIVNNYRDIPDDIAAGKLTLAVRFGRMAMLRLYILDALAAAVLMVPTWLCLSPWLLAVPAVYFIASVMIAGRMRKLQGSALNPWLGRTSVLMCLYSLIFLIAAAAA